MGKITVHTIGTIQIKMDTKDDVYFDAKEPHVSFVRKGQVILNHLLLSEVCDLVGRDREEKDAIYWVRDNRKYLEELYLQSNR